MNRRTAYVLALALSVLIAGCEHRAAAAPQPAAQSISASCRPQLLTRLYFGLSSVDGPVGDAVWQAFVDDHVTPRFPQGLTVFDGQGQWRSAQGVVTKEASRIIEVVHADAASQHRGLAEIAGTYRERFSQEAVLMAQSPVRACLSGASPFSDATPRSGAKSN